MKVKELREQVLGLAHQNATMLRQQDHLQNVETLERKLANEVIELGEAVKAAAGVITGSVLSEVADVAYYAVQIDQAEEKTHWTWRFLADRNIGEQLALELAIVKYQSRAKIGKNIELENGFCLALFKLSEQN